MTFFQRLKQLIRGAGDRPASQDRSPRRSDPQFVGGTNIKDIENAPEGKGQELAGHAVERVET
jgi:hypothetical protein